MTDRLTKWQQPPDDPGFWETKRMPKKEYVVKLSVLVAVEADNPDDAEEKATTMLEQATSTVYWLTDIETEEVEEV